MKTMNYLFMTVFILLLSACSTENQSVEEELSSVDFRGRKSQEKEKEHEEKSQEGPVYLELDLHQWALEYELHELRLELVRIEEEIESSEGYVSEELQGSLERVQRMIDEGRFEHERNSEVISEYRGPRGPGRGGNPCGEGDIERCPLELENATIYIFGREGFDSKMTRDDDTCGELVDLAEMPEYQGQVLEAVYEAEPGCADEIRFNGVNADGQRFTYSHPVAH